MKILVTGANGFLGQGIVKSILDNGYDVIATDIDVKYIDHRADKRKCDVFQLKNPYEYLGTPDVLLHLAWRDGFMHYSDAHINDLPKHYMFIKTMIESGLKRVAVMGSMHEIGFFEGSIKEDTPCHPITPYGIGKNALRDLTQMLAKKEDIIFQWLRGYYIVSNSEFGSSIFSKLAIAAKDGKKDFPFTMGQNQYDFIEYTDFCKQVAAAVEQDEINGIINICSGKPEKLADRVERFIKENGYLIKLKYGEFPDRPYDSQAVWADASKIEKIIKSHRYKN